MNISSPIINSQKKCDVIDSLATTKETLIYSTLVILAKA